VTFRSPAALLRLGASLFTFKMNIKENLWKLVRDTYGPFFPTPKAKRVEFLDKVRERVDYYKPRIEDKCQISLGNVKVKDNKEWLHDVAFHDISCQATELAWKNGRIPNKSDFNIVCSVSSLSYGLLLFPLFVYNNWSGADFRHHNNTIYVPFYYMNRFNDIDFKNREKEIDYGVVHELSHSLWDKIAGPQNPRTSFRTEREWFEGFATYCADDYFSEFYPEGTKRVEVNGVYTRGKEKVQTTIQKIGENILLQIPRRWQELDKTFH